MDRKSAFFLSSAAVVGLLVSVLQGCNLQDIVKVDVPDDVQVALGFDARVPLGQAPVVKLQWIEYVERNTKELDREIGEGEDRFQVLSSLADTGIGLASAEASNIPGGGILVAALAGLGGLFIRKPGDRKRIQALEAS